jgi:indole-3-glycerol phosphate synthase
MKVMPEGATCVSESGITTPHDILELKSFGYSGFLIGENFMKEENPGAAFRRFADQLK